MLVDIGLSIGFVFGFTFILGTFANNYFSDREHPAIPYDYMAVIAGIGAVLLLAFPALFLVLDWIF